MTGGTKRAAWAVWLLAVAAAASSGARAADTAFTTGIPENEVVNSSTSTHQGIIGEGNFTGGTGIVTVNQAPGNVNNQGNLIHLGLFQPVQLIPVSPDTAASDTGPGRQTVVNGAVRKDSIAADSFSAFTGISAVNQITGNGTGQKNIIGISLGAGAIQPLTQQDLMSVSTAPASSVTLTNSSITDSIQGSALTGISGVMAASQSGGDLNRNTSAIGISFNTVTLH